MAHVIDVLLEVFTWIGLGGGLLLAVVAVALWAADGTWLAAEAIVDREGDETVVRWFDADGDANRAVATTAEAAVLEGLDAASIWYRHGWQGRMRLTRRAPALRALALSAGGMVALGILCLVASWIVYFARA